MQQFIDETGDGLGSNRTGRHRVAAGRRELGRGPHVVDYRNLEWPLFRSIRLIALFAIGKTNSFLQNDGLLSSRLSTICPCTWRSSLTSNSFQRLTRWLTVLFAAIIMAAVVVVYLVYGRDDTLLITSKSIPAALRTNPSTMLEGYIGRCWGGDNFEFGDTEELHYFWLAGIDCPEPGQPFFQPAKQFLLSHYRHKTLQLTVDGYDHLKREFGHAFHTDREGVTTDVALELLKAGLAWYDGSQFEGDQAYKDAFEAAKEAKIGLWSQSSPVAPWEYWQRQQQALIDSPPIETAGEGVSLE